MDKSNWSLIFERPKRREEKGGGKERRRGIRERSQKGMELCIDLYGYMTFVWILVRFGMDLWISCMEF